jgi:hypothetical protein
MLRGVRFLRWAALSTRNTPRALVEILVGNFHAESEKFRTVPCASYYLDVASRPSSERVCITRKIESRVTMPMTWAPPSEELLTTGI